jgi:hypothetical protein
VRLPDKALRTHDKSWPRRSTIDLRTPILEFTFQAPPRAILALSVERRTPMQPERRYYLAVIRPENLQRLVDAGLNYYALRTNRRPIAPGDRILLYRSRDRARSHRGGGSGAVGGSGVVGAFEVTEEPRAPGRGTRDIFAMLYPTQIPWRQIVLCLNEPLPIADLVAKLSMFTNKERYGSALQTTLRRITRDDYELIESELKRHADAD